MKWKDVREKYKNMWVLIEELESESIKSKRIISDMSVIEAYDNGAKALQAYAERHKKDKSRRMYVFHTKNKELIINERKWIGVRGI